jgi:membrane-bound lytic murein transglycosylase MltF
MVDSIRLPLYATLLALLLGCGETSRNAATIPAPAPAAAPDPVATASVESVKPAVEPPPKTTTFVPFGVGLEPFHGDFDALRERRIIRVLVGFSQTHFFLDGLTPRGITAEVLEAFEKFLARKLGGTDVLTVVPIPVARDQMINHLADGLGDLAVGNLTITPARLRRVDFSLPSMTGVKEVIVTGSRAKPLTALDELAGQTVFIRDSSSFRESVEHFNADLSARGLTPMGVVSADENLQTEDILELANAGVIGLTIADNYIADFWAGVLPDIQVHHNLAISSDRAIGWAIRKDATGLKPLVDEFVRAHRKGTLVGNILFKRYLQSEDFVKNAGATEDRLRLIELSHIFRRYSSEYTFDWLLIAAQAYQESRLIHNTRSAAGAVGVMQILPKTARSPAVSINNFEDLDANIHAGHKYLRHLIDHYFADPGIDEYNRALFAFAAYNAGPTRIRRIRRTAQARGLDPDIWFGNVELLVAEQVGREPVQYVRNILKYYTTYSLLRDHSGEVVSDSAAL